MIEVTDYYFDPSFLETDFHSRDLGAKSYKPGFDIVEDFATGFDLFDWRTVHEKANVFPDKIWYLYKMNFNHSLDWHSDGMIMDFKSSAKYAALISGTGTLDVEDQSYTFTEPYRWVRFDNLKMHRFTNTGAMMVMASTAPAYELEALEPNVVEKSKILYNKTDIENGRIFWYDNGAKVYYDEYKNNT